MSQKLKQSAELTKHLLGCIDLKDIEKLKQKGLNSGELKNRASDTEIFYKKHFEDVIKLLIQAQIEWIAMEADDEYKLQFGRGAVSGLLVVMEWFDERVRESMAKFNDNEKAEPGEALASTGELKV